MRFKALTAIACALLFLPGQARAEPSEIRMGLQNGLPYLPFVVMEHEKLIEKHAKAGGLGDIKVTWFRAAGGDVLNDGLLSGNLDFAATGIVSFLNLWSRAQGKSPIIALSAYSSSTLQLVTRNPDVKTIADFTDKDKIAVPAVQSSLQAITLQLAAEKTFGPEGRNKLDRLTISRGHPDAMAGLLSGTEITAHFSAPPYQEQELKDPRIRVVLSVNEVFGGPVCNGLLYMTERFYKQNPKAVAAVNAALGEAEKLINADARRAAEIYLAVTKEKNTVEGIMANITAAGSKFEQAPHGIGKISDFMYRTGATKAAPASWKDLLIPESHGLAGD